MRMEWLLCPICKSKTRLQLREDTELKIFPLYCPKCKQKTLINVKDLRECNKNREVEPYALNLHGLYYTLIQV